MIKIFDNTTKILICSVVLLVFFTQSNAATAQELAEHHVIKLGMSTALSGPAAELGKNMQEGVLTGFDRVNRRGGIEGRKLKLLTLDDGYEPTRTAPNMRRLIQEEKVLAVLGNVGTPTAISAIPIANQEKTLIFAPFTGAGVLRKDPPDRYVINFRASYEEEIAAMIDALIGVVNLTPSEIAVFSQRDAYGDAGYHGTISALKRHGLKDENTVPHVRYERNTLAVENALATLLFLRAPPRAIIMVGAYGPCAKFIKLARTVGVNALFLNVSFVGSTPLANALGKQIQNVIVTQVVPHPIESSLPIVKEFQTDLMTFSPSSRPTFGSLEGYIAARILIHALNHIKGQPTREGIVTALESLQSFDLGLGKPLYLSAQRHQASHQVWPTILRNGKFVSFHWQDLEKVINHGRS